MVHGHDEWTGPVTRRDGIGRRVRPCIINYLCLIYLLSTRVHTRCVLLYSRCTIAATQLQHLYTIYRRSFFFNLIGLRDRLNGLRDVKWTTYCSGSAHAGLKHQQTRAINSPGVGSMLGQRRRRWTNI